MVMSDYVVDGVRVALAIFTLIAIAVCRCVVFKQKTAYEI